MGRLASAVDWMGTVEGSSPGFRLSEIRLQVSAARTPELIEEPPPPSDDLIDLDREAELEDDPPTERFLRLTPDAPPDPVEQMTARGIARLSALAHWMEVEGDDASRPVVGLVRACLQDLADVQAALAALRAATSDASLPTALRGAVSSLGHAIGLWRANVVEHIDDLALSDHRSFTGWASLPEYSAAYTLAVVQPALDEVEAWAIARRPAAAIGAGERGEPALLTLVLGLGASVAQLNTTLRAVTARPSGAAPFPGASPRVSAW